jgi:DNA-binding MarR family transcriptional regulator
MAGVPSPRALAGRVWSAMFDFLMRSAPARTRTLADRGLTPSDSRALFSLDTREGRSMRSLADAWACDPSNATWIVDRLEMLGLAERRAVPRDRRVRLVALTPAGVRMRAALMKEFRRPPAELLALDPRDLQALDRILSKLAPDGDAAGSDPPAPAARRVRRTGSRR